MRWTTVLSSNEVVRRSKALPRPLSWHQDGCDGDKSLARDNGALARIMSEPGSQCGLTLRSRQASFGQAPPRKTLAVTIRFAGQTTVRFCPARLKRWAS